MPLLYLYGLLLLVTPFFTIFLLIRQARLRRQLSELIEVNEEQHLRLQRAVGELQSKLAATVQPATLAAEKPVATEVRQHVPVSTATIVPPTRLPPAAPPSETQRTIAPLVPPSIPAAERKPEAEQEQKPSVPLAPLEPKPLAPAAQTPPWEGKSTPAPIPPKIVLPPSVVFPPATPIPPPKAIPPAAAARVSSPSPISSLSIPAPKPTFQQRMKTVSTIEETLGTNWLNKLGIIILVVGVALFGIYELGNLGVAGKAVISFAVALSFLAGGIYVEKRERFRVFGRTLIGGGWALLFFSTYGIYHVAAMHILDSLVLDCILMLAVALGMAAHTLRYKSQLVTGLAFLLGYTTVALSFSNVSSLSSAGTSEGTVYGLVAGVILAIGLVAIVLKMGWFELEVFGILSSYLNHLYWLSRILGVDGAHGRAFPEYHASLAILFFYWLAFRISYILRGIKTDLEENVSTVSALLNTVLLLGVMKFQSVQPQLAYLALLVLGALEFTIAQLPITKRRRSAFVILSTLGAALMIAAVPFHYSGNPVAYLWLVGAEVFLFAGITLEEGVFRRLGLCTGLLVGIDLLGFNFRPLVELRAKSEALALAAGILFAFCSVVFYLNALGIASRWRDFFRDSLDRRLLDVHSYLGAFAAATAAWALFSNDWTALAFAVIMLALAFLARLSESRHLQVQYSLLAVLTLFRISAFNLHFEARAHAHINTRLITLPILGAIFYFTARLAALRDDQNQRVLRGLFAFSGTLLFAALIWFEVPELWQPLAFIAFGVTLSESARALRYQPLWVHAHGLTLLACFTAFNADPNNIHLWHTIPVHALAALPVVTGCYWIAKRLGVENLQHLKIARAAYTWIAAGAMVWIIEEAVHAPWIAVGWIAFAVALAFSTRWIRYRQLAWQANVVALCAFVRTLLINYDLTGHYGPLSLRLITVSIVAAGLYAISRKAGEPGPPYALPLAYLRTTAATSLLALLMWHESSTGWLVALWALFAFALAAVDRRFKMDDLRWQAHALAGLALVRSVGVNLYVAETWHNLSVRLLSLSIVAVIFYAMSRLIRMPDEWRARDFHHIYSWSASLLVSLLLWHELQPLSVAVGWAVFGLVLFEYGLLRKVSQFRYQSFIALIAAFTRIFFVNLTAGEPGEFWGPRFYTILPLVLIFFFVFAQIPEKEENVARGPRFRFDILLAYLGTATVVALFYFQFAPDWVVTSDAAVVFVLFGVAWVLHRPVFLHQGILLTLGTFARGMAHNLFGAGYFGEAGWRGRFFVIGSATAILLATLFFAFALRGRHAASPTASRGQKALAVLAARPEQLQFFVPIILLTTMLALKMREGMVTVSWGIEGVLIILLALAVKERSFRLTGLGMLLLCVVKVLAMDAWRLETRDRYITFIIVGAALMAVSSLYIRFRENIRQYL